MVAFSRRLLRNCFEGARGHSPLPPYPKTPPPSLNMPSGFAKRQGKGIFSHLRTVKRMFQQLANLKSEAADYPCQRAKGQGPQIEGRGLEE